MSAKSPQPNFLMPYLIELSELSKCARLSFSLLEQSIIQLSIRPSRSRTESGHHVMVDMNKYWSNRNYNQTLNRVGLHSFIHSAANICKIIWPYTDNNTKDPFKSQKENRKTEFEKFFPVNSYPNLIDKEFRNFIEHFDERLDTWNATSKKHNIVMSWMGKNTSLPKGDITTMRNFDPETFTIMYYHETKGTEITDLRELYKETERIRLELPNIMGVIRGTPANYYDSLIDI